VSSWFPSQNSSEEDPKQSSSELSVPVASAAKNSPLAAFPVSPPTSEPPISAGKKIPAEIRSAVKVHTKSTITDEPLEDAQKPSKRRRVGSAATDQKGAIASVRKDKGPIENDVQTRSPDLASAQIRLDEVSDDPVSLLKPHHCANLTVRSPPPRLLVEEK
jgi:hypothetical protein